jgi:hypothetical protein
LKPAAEPELGSSQLGPHYLLDRIIIWISVNPSDGLVKTLAEVAAFGGHRSEAIEFLVAAFAYAADEMDRWGTAGGTRRPERNAQMQICTYNSRTHAPRQSFGLPAWFVNCCWPFFFYVCVPWKAVLNFLLVSVGGSMRPCLDVRKFCLFNVSHIVACFVCLWQILSYHGLTRLKRFVTRSTSKLCN